MNQVLRYARCAAFALAMSACSDAEPESRLMTVRDSADVRIVEHAAEATPAAQWTIDLAAAAEFAMPEDEAPLYRVSEALRLGDGRVVAADAGNNRLVVFEADGPVSSTFGREGDGPGEFRNMLVMRPWIADSLVVWDDRARRVSVITPEATFARSFSLTLPEGVPFARVLGVYPDGSFLGMSFTNMGRRPLAGLQRAPIRLHHFTPDGTSAATVGEVPGTEAFYTTDASGQVGLYPPHFYRSGHHLASDRLLVAPNDRWELTFRSAEGEAVQVVRWLKPPTPVTADAVATSLERLMERTPEARRGATRAVAGELDIHETMPAFDDVFYDRLGRVWLQAYDPSGGDLSEWTVVGPAGELIAGTTVPRGLQFRDAGPDWALVRVLDELGVERLLLATIER